MSLTQLPISEKDLQDAERARRAMLAHTRHDLRTPLNAIIGYSEMLIEDAADASDDRMISQLNRVLISGRQILTAINDVMSPARLDSLERSELGSLGHELREAVRNPLAVVIQSSDQMIEQARSSGSGELDELSKINSAGRRLEGLVEEFSGLPGIDSADPDLLGGATDVTALVQAVVKTIPRLETGDLGAGAMEQSHILIADDQETNRDLLRRRLERQGHRVSVAENGRVAVEMLRSEPFDLLLLDVMMPEMNGYEALQLLKSDELLRHLPVIMISALDEIDSVVRCIEMGAEDYLPKTFDPVLLKARIDACLEKKRLRDRETLYLRQIEQEKRRADELLHVILPEAIVQELAATNRVEPRQVEDVAVLFCDVVDFTPYCAANDPQEVYENLQRLIERFEEIAADCGLQKIKTIGDSFMATAGLLYALENPVLNAVRCGLQMVKAAAEVTTCWQVRVGVHVGSVMAGVVGRQQYLFDVWGDTVNTAARVEKHGRPGLVNVSAEAWSRISEHANGESLGLIQVKGIGEMELFGVDRLSRLS